jgi:hypothetical protein
MTVTGISSEHLSILLRLDLLGNRHRGWHPLRQVHTAALGRD